MKTYLTWVFIFVVLSDTSLMATPAWWTDPPGAAPTTYQEWTFDTDADPALPETDLNNNGTASIDVYVDGYYVGDPGWYENWLGRSGVWHGAVAQMTVTVPNNSDSSDYKEVWLELGYRSDIFDWEVLSPTAGVTFLGATSDYVGDGWQQLDMGWLMEPSVSEEVIYLEFWDGGANLDYVIVDTRSGNYVTFPDALLENKIRDELGIPAPIQITDMDMLDLTSLTRKGAVNNKILNLTGLEYALNLNYLNLWNNDISDLSALSSLTKLTELDLAFNNISDVSSLANLPNLTRLHLYVNNISDLSVLSNLPSLTELALEGNSIYSVSGLANIPSLMFLGLSYNNIIDLSDLTELTNLYELRLKGNPLKITTVCTYFPIIGSNNPNLYCIDYYDYYDPNPLTEDCSMDLGDLGELSAHWLESGCDEGNNWCSGADLDVLTMWI
ncbi:MAG: leucine-rich repeat domain-containing protein [Sedimentisphaerales bacterium]|nr:leucine-rich repeat domain-containing protein [Sedimentisphaerales bacterium]